MENIVSPASSVEQPTLSSGPLTLVPPFSKTEPQTKNKLFLVIPLGMLLLVVGVGGYLLGQRNSQNVAQVIVTPTPTDQISGQIQASPSSTPVNFSNGRVNNLGNILSFQYPSTLFLDQMTASDKQIVIYNKDPRENTSDVYYFQVDITQNSSLEGLFNNKTYKMIATKIGNRQVMQVLGIEKPGGVSEEDYYFDEGMNLVHFSIGNIPNDKETNTSYLLFRTEVDQIVATFKFVN